MSIRLTSMKVMRALAAFPDPKDVRPWTRGVWVESSANGLVLWATDGAAVAGIYVGGPAAEGCFTLLIPLDVIARAPKTGDAELELEGPSLEVAFARFTWGDEKLTMADFRRVIPREVTGEAAQLDVALLQKFSTLAEATGARSKKTSGRILVSHNGQGTARVHFPGLPSFVGALQPLRPSANALPEDHLFNPHWI